MTRPVDLLFPEKAVLKSKGKCPICAEDVKLDELKDVLSVKEFFISGICQSCQDEIFIDPNEELRKLDED